jgi:hypothetical protein
MLSWRHTRTNVEMGSFAAARFSLILSRAWNYQQTLR